LTFYFPAKGFKISMQELACRGLVVGGRFYVDKLLRELDRVDRH